MSEGMSVLSCAEVRELAPELALGILGGAERADVVLHVNHCARCQAYVVELTEAADAIPELVPEMEPPAGFEGRVLQRLDESRRRSRRRWFAAVAAVAAAVAILSITVVRVVESTGDTTTAAQSASTSFARKAPVQVSMTGGAASTPAGWAYVADRHGVALAVDYGVAPGKYAVQVKPVKGDAAMIGTIRIEAEHGSWTGHSPRALTAGARIALLDMSGHEVCHGTVPAAE